LRFSCGRLASAARNAPEARGMDIETADLLAAELVLRDVEDLDSAWFEAELAEQLPEA